MTGSGKTRVLHELTLQGEQVLDLEGLANHRGSVLGGDPLEPQPAQKAFETRLWNALRSMDPARIIYVESESKKVGGVHIPDALMEQIRIGQCIELRSQRKTRVSWLLREYQHFVADTDNFKEKLSLLTSRYGKEQIASWHAAIEAGQFASLVEELLELHYDPAYQSSIVRNFPLYREDAFVQLEDDSDVSFVKAAEAILSRTTS
jgi:tRNA 2-selenouridine synthase